MSAQLLVIDDEQVIRDGCVRVLEKEGHQVRTAENGELGLTFMAETAADVVLLDLTIPGGTGGKDTVRELLRIDPSATVIASSGYSNDPVMANYRAYGFREVIVKPFRIDDLGEVLHKVINHPME